MRQGGPSRGQAKVAVLEEAQLDLEQGYKEVID